MVSVREVNLHGCNENLRFSCVMLLAWLLCWPSLSAAELPLNVYVGQGQMPYADDKAGNHGLFGELMQAMCDRLQRECRYVSVPWKRVQLEVATDPQGIVLSLGRVAEREDGFIWLLDVLPSSYVLASQGKSYGSLSQALTAGPVVVMAGTPRSLELQALKQPGQVVVEVTDPKQAARMLHSGRVSAWYEIDMRVNYLWHLLGYPPAEIQFGTPINVTHNYIAGSPILEDAALIQRQMRQAFAELQADGSWGRILTRYLGEQIARELLQQP